MLDCVEASMEVLDASRRWWSSDHALYVIVNAGQDARPSVFWAGLDARVASNACGLESRAWRCQ